MTKMTKEEAVYVLNLLKRQDLKINSAATEAIDLAISALEKQEADRWIPVTKRLPKEKDAGGILKKLGTNMRSDYVLATVEVKGERMTVTACTYDGKWNWNMKYAFHDYKVIAWKPLPEPYKAEEES